MTDQDNGRGPGLWRIGRRLRRPALWLGLLLADAAASGIVARVLEVWLW